ncbi:MAG TPA: PIG-L family deacetylase [Thermoanaerobaculia bacterium]|nr:PIG-L family deacetylase [Thermoanaerobaculia bacterium]
MRPPFLLRCCLALALLAVAPGAGATGVLEPFVDPLEPAGAGGYERVERVLAKLSGHRRVLVVGAHPDDEDTTLLALVARLAGGESAYLSLSRGEGGQNLIGPELGPALGLVRSRELLAARQLDGARQFFTRGYDFGYTRSLDETFSLWPREVLLEDTVRVIRRFRPQVVVSVFPPDERAGHGQHQAAGVITEAAFHAAGDPTIFPEMAAEGLPPWRPLALYRNTWWRGTEETTVRLAAGTPDPLTGRTAFQTAMSSRSSHRSQDMGMLQPLGPQEARLGWVAGEPGTGGEHVDGNLFRGIDTRLAAIAELLPGAELAEAVAERLTRAEALAVETREGLSAVALPGAVPRLVEILDLLRQARSAIAAGGEGAGGGAVHAVALLDERIALAELGLAAAAGVAVDAVADRAAVAPGDAWQVEAIVAMPPPGGGVPADLLGVELLSPADRPIVVSAVELGERPASRFQPTADPLQGFHVRGFRAEVPPGTAPTMPYFLERPLAGALYDWSPAPPEVHGEPFGPPPLTARFHLRLAGVELALDREVVHRERDQEIGEIRHPLAVVPAIEVAAAPDLVVWPVDRGGSRWLAVTLTSRAAQPLSGRLEPSVPEGWPAPPQVPFSLAAAGQEGAERTFELPLTAPDPLAPGAYRVRLVARVDGRPEPLALALPVIDYPHIRPTPRPEPAIVAISAADIDLPPLGRVGYVRGAADRVPEMLAEVGIPVEILDAAALATGDLAAYDAIVVGSRAYETDPALARANPRLLDYTRGGGLTIVQYQQYQFVAGGFAPFALDIARPHGRVTDEAAPVTLLEPTHPVFHRPNAITAGDWDGWVQERGLYFPATWDEAYRPLLAIADPGREPERGALLVATLGKGTWVYTGLAFFRQLPAGVPGAYRLFANLLALEAD